MKVQPNSYNVDNAGNYGTVVSMEVPIYRHIRANRSRGLYYSMQTGMISTSVYLDRFEVYEAEKSEFRFESNSMKVKRALVNKIAGGDFK